MEKKNPHKFYNPLDKKNLGKSVVDALLESVELPLSVIDDFYGAGIYAIYYKGAFEPYSGMSDQNQCGGEYPIYIGKAIPKGGRKGVSTEVSQKTKALSIRLRQHANSISIAENLEISDFSFRHLVVDDIWIPLGEAMALKKFTPLWNRVVDGFGNHDPGSGRYGGKRPLWDELHPGRQWAKKCQSPKLSTEEILESIAKHFEDLF